MQLKIAYSVHRDLNVKGNNERSRDYTLPEPGASFAGASMQPGGYAGNGFMGGADGMSAPSGTNLHITGGSTAGFVMASTCLELPGILDDHLATKGTWPEAWIVHCFCWCELEKFLHDLIYMPSLQMAISISIVCKSAASQLSPRDTLLLDPPAIQPGALSTIACHR